MRWATSRCRRRRGLLASDSLRFRQTSSDSQTAAGNHWNTRNHGRKTMRGAAVADNAIRGRIGRMAAAGGGVAPEVVLVRLGGGIAAVALALMLSGMAGPVRVR